MSPIGWLHLQDKLLRTYYDYIVTNYVRGTTYIFPLLTSFAELTTHYKIWFSCVPPVRHEIEHVDFILDFGGL